MELWQWALVGLGVVIVLVVIGLTVWWKRRRPTEQDEEANQDDVDDVVADLEAAAAAFGNLPPMGLELPDPEVEITPDWARGVAEAAEHVAERQRAAIAGRTNRRRALRAVQQIRRGAERVRTIEEAASDEARQINEVGAEIGIDPLEIRSEEEEDAAIRRLRRANDAADAI
jgi:hypothetical protein